MHKRIALALTLALAGCTAAPLTSPPTLASTSPADKATNVARDASITATFSEPMVSSSIGATTFTLSPAVAGTVSSSGATATFKPSQPFAYGTTYTAKVTTGANGEAGGPLATDLTWSFTIVPAAPAVTSTSPDSNATGVGIDAAVTATFSKPMAPGSITAASFTISPAVAGAVTSSGTTATFTPSAHFAFNTLYTATITADAKDTTGTALAAPYTWSFTTATAMAPTVSLTSPMSNAPSVPVGAAITATFSKVMSPASITTGSFKVEPGVSGTVTPSGSKATFTPSAPLAFGTPYTATITTDAQDTNGTPLATLYSWKFTTAFDPAPEVAATSPGDLAPDVARNVQVTATFSQEMLASSISLTSFLIAPSIAGDVTYSGSTATFTLTPGTLFKFGTTYTATITTAAQNKNHTPLTAEKKWSFVTVLDPPPTVTATSPTPGATGVSITGKLSATFSMAMKGISLDTRTFKVTRFSKLGPVPVGGTVNYIAANHMATFTPDPYLLYSVTYTATLTTGALNENDTPLGANATWTFQAEPQPPGPVANASPTQDVKVQTLVTLDGSATGGTPPLKFEWKPVLGIGPAVTLSSSNVASPTFTAPADVTTVEFDLIVTDSDPTGNKVSNPRRVQINVTANTTTARFVNGTYGSDGNAGTSRDLPLKTIQFAVQNAGANSAVYVTSGDYGDSIGTLTLYDGVSIYGGFDDITWVRGPSPTTHFWGGPTAISGSTVTALVIDGLYVTSTTSSVAGTSSYGFLLSNTIGVKLTNNKIRTARGAQGSPGVAGGAGADGVKGTDGAPGCSGNGIYCPDNGRPGGGTGSSLGGAGGTGQWCLDGTVGAGATGGGTGGAKGLKNTLTNNPGTGGGNGNPGGNVTVVATGGTTPTTDQGVYNASGYTPANGSAGTTGTAAPGGGGGGGGGSYGNYNFGGTCNSTGNGGGGGGGGGAGGSGGGGGGGGGGSFGIYVASSTGFGQIGNDNLAGGGGLGGPGVDGASGGANGQPGFGSIGPDPAHLGKGGDGGFGGHGGTGGRGGDGPIGPSRDWP